MHNGTQFSKSPTPTIFHIVSHSNFPTEEEISGKSAFKDSSCKSLLMYLDLLPVEDIRSK